MTILETGIQKYETIIIGKRILGGGVLNSEINPIGIKFVDCKINGIKEEKFSEWAPVWRLVTKGINIEGVFI